MTLNLKRLTKRFGGAVALDSLDLRVERGEVVALIGPNGSGKTTALNCITGIIRADAGAIHWRDDDITDWPLYARARGGIARTFQELRVFPSLSVIENVLIALSSEEETLAHSFRRSALRRMQASHVERARAGLETVGLDRMRNHLAGQLSYGQRRLLDLSRVLISDAALYLLDEPTAGVSPLLLDTILSSIDHLRRSDRAVVFIEHNFETLDIATRAVLLDAGRKILDGSPGTVRTDPLTLQVYFGSTE